VQKKQGGDRRFVKRTVAAVAALVVTVGSTAWGADSRSPLHFLATNDDIARAAPPNTVSFYDIAADGALTNPAALSSGGNGIAGGYLGVARLVVTTGDDSACVYASNAQSENVTAIDARERKVVGLFHGSLGDVKIARNGVGLALGSNYLYAAFSGSNNIAAFHIQSGCKLDFVGEVRTEGLSGGTAEGFAVRGNTMVVTYGDGSVRSFDVSAGLPNSHEDAQYLPGSRVDFNPGAVDITKDGRYAIFGGGSTISEVQVSELRSGKITPPKVYKLGGAWGSDGLRLSPDESVLYISNSSGGRVSAAFFDNKAGVIQPGCTSAPLRGFFTKFAYIGSVAMELPSGTGGTLYVPEFNTSGGSDIGVLQFTRSKAGCTLTETAHSPVAGAYDSALLSIAVYPPRPF
jgi:hypothetical protein